MSNDFTKTNKELRKAKLCSGSGGEYWMGRNIQTILGYDKWDKFEHVIKRAIMACESAGMNPDDHFLQTGKLVKIGSGASRRRGDYFLTRYACYLVAMNGDTKKPEIGIAQTYFAVQARRQEMQDKLTSDVRRIQYRDRLKDRNNSLNGVAKQAGVQNYGLFHDAGYKGLYEMGLADIKRRKKIPSNESLLDRAGRTELAANEFKATQTEEKLIKDNIQGEKEAINTHYSVGKEVRNTIKKIKGIMPEDLPIEPHINKVMGRNKKENKLPPN